MTQKSICIASTKSFWKDWSASFASTQLGHWHDQTSVPNQTRAWSSPDSSRWFDDRGMIQSLFQLICCSMCSKNRIKLMTYYSIHPWSIKWWVDQKKELTSLNHTFVFVILVWSYFEKTTNSYVWFDRENSRSIRPMILMIGSGQNSWKIYV